MVPYDQAYEVGFEDMPRRVPDISKIHKQIGFRPKTSLDAIIQSVIEHHKKAPSASG
jgi:UDP-glucose 4-epimerase